MSETLKINANTKYESEKSNNNKQFSQSGIYVKEDDQDWGSSGMNNIEVESK